MKQIRSTVSIALSCILTFAAVGNAADIGLKGVGGRLALVMPEGEADTTFGLGVVADLGTIVELLNLEASVEYWGDSWEVPGLEVSWSSITIGGTAKYHFPLDMNISPFAGGGLALAIGRSKSEWKTSSLWLGQPGSSSSSDTNIGFHVVGGADIPISPTMKITAEAKYAIDGYDTILLIGSLLFKL